jgi:L-aspartate oxidase
VPVELGLERGDARRPLRVPRDVVGEAGVVSEPLGHAGTVPAVPEQPSDLIVVGAGAAGLFASLVAAEHGASVTLISARPLAETASYWAQGGLAAALSVEDSPAQHLDDTLVAGRGLVRRSAAEVLCDEAPARFADLERLGVRFDADRHGNLALGLEGGHKIRRVVHAGGSATGRRILRQLSADVVAEPRIEVLEDRRARALLTADGRVTGVAVDDGQALRARATILASGGAAALWSRTTNPPGSFGSGLLLARAAGAELADLEFVQFHPTAVVGLKGREGYLVTEAIRGEGATLHDARGERFVDELAPRDAVARAIHRLLVERDEPAVYLDMTHIDPARFPNVVTALREAGLDPATQRIPVSPASHYVMGGITTDLEGRSTVAGLYAVGECACTGLHGANRLASNSLSECFVFGRRAALAGLGEPLPQGPVPPAPEGDLAPAPSRATRTAMWVNAGLERDAEHLRALLSDPHPLARLVAASAIAREESRGAHARAEFPDPDPALDHRHSVLAAGATSPALVEWT